MIFIAFATPSLADGQRCSAVLHPKTKTERLDDDRPAELLTPLVTCLFNAILFSDAGKES